MAPATAAEIDYKAMVETQALQLSAMQEQLATLAARLPVVEVIPPVGGKFPLLVYKEGHKKGQIDHPGNLVKRVLTEKALQAALAEGWSETPHPFVYEEPEEVVTLPKKGAKK